MTNVLIKPNTPGAYLTGLIGQQGAYGSIIGMTFQFSDGTNLAYTSAWGIGSNLSASFPNGCDKIQYISSNGSCRTYPFTIMAVLMSKLGVALPSIDGRPYYGSINFMPGGVNWQGNKNGIISVAPGQVIGSLMVFIDCFNSGFEFIQAYGVPDPAAKPVDGGWSAWSAPSICSAACGLGLTLQTRTCTNPPPALGGKECSADGSSDVQTAPCNLGPCPVNGGWSAWDPWGDCVGDCSTGLGTQSRKRYCNNPSPANGGTQCEGNTSETRICNMTTCPVDGGWSPYSEWNLCSAACGGGTQTRSRTCTNPSPVNGGVQCIGDAVDSQSCNTQPCPTNGGWGEWLLWGTCDPITKTQTRNRLCNNPSPNNGGLYCVGSATQTQSCSPPVDGGFSDWLPWSECKDGLQKRNRLCNNPAPSNGGIDCIGDFTQTQTCTMPIPSTSTIATPASISLGVPGTANETTTISPTTTTPTTTPTIPTTVITAPPDPTTGHITSTVTTGNPDGSTSTTEVTHDPATGTVVSVVPVTQPNYTLFFIVVLVISVALYYSLMQTNTSTSTVSGANDIALAIDTGTNTPFVINI
jgi:hypothetical protein